MPHTRQPTCLCQPRWVERTHMPCKWWCPWRGPSAVTISGAGCADQRPPRHLRRMRGMREVCADQRPPRHLKRMRGKREVCTDQRPPRHSKGEERYRKGMSRSKVPTLENNKPPRLSRMRGMYEECTDQRPPLCLRRMRGMYAECTD